MGKSYSVAECKHCGSVASLDPRWAEWKDMYQLECPHCKCCGEGLSSLGAAVMSWNNHPDADRTKFHSVKFE